ncbi:hypothetical protein MRX96_042913 [Rhipicephalus microplus]
MFSFPAHYGPRQASFAGWHIDGHGLRAEAIVINDVRESSNCAPLQELGRDNDEGGTITGLETKKEKKGGWSVAAKVREKERGRRGSLLGRWVPDLSLVTAEPGLPATYYLPRPCVADVLRLPGILCPRTRGAVGIRAQVPAEVSGPDTATVVVPTLQVAAWSTVRIA